MSNLIEVDFQFTHQQIVEAIKLYAETVMYRGRVSITSHVFCTNEANAAAFKQVVIRCRGTLDPATPGRLPMATMSRSPKYLPTAEDPYEDEEDDYIEVEEIPPNGKSPRRK